jgi:mannose-6-phosphate isomerase class I
VLRCEYFALELVDSDGVTIERDTEQRSFEAVTVIEGSCVLTNGEHRLGLARYDSAVVPAHVGRYRFAGDAPFRALVSTVP